MALLTHNGVLIETHFQLVVKTTKILNTTNFFSAAAWTELEKSSLGTHSLYLNSFKTELRGN